jgi:hypothetical protein
LQSKLDEYSKVFGDFASLDEAVIQKQAEITSLSAKLEAKTKVFLILLLV